MARLPPGTPPQPIQARMRRYRDELETRGGRRVIVDLEREGADALAILLIRDSLNVKDTVSAALVKCAQESP